MYEYKYLTRTIKIVHDVDVGDPRPIKQYTYRSHPVKQQILQYLLENGFIEPPKSEWSSPCVLVPKPDLKFSNVYGLSQRKLVR